MANEGDDERRSKVIASVATRLFGAEIPPDAVNDESLWRATDPSLKPGDLVPQLQEAIDADLPAFMTDDELKSHPLAVWVELEIGLKDGKRLTRRLPITLAAAAKRLAAEREGPKTAAGTSCRQPDEPYRHVLEARTMKATYDARTDTLSIILKADAAVVEGDEDKPGVILDYDGDGNLVSLEILDASTRVTEARRIEFETVG